MKYYVWWHTYKLNMYLYNTRVHLAKKFMCKVIFLFWLFSAIDFLPTPLKTKFKQIWILMYVSLPVFFYPPFPFVFYNSGIPIVHL